MKSSKSPRILVGVPYHEKKQYALNHAVKAVNKLTYPNKEVMMRWDFGEYGGKNNVKIQRETFRNIALYANFDYLFFLGIDTLPPPDVLERLLMKMRKRDKSIIGGVYWGRHQANNGKTDGAVAWIHGMTPEKQKETFLQADNVVEVDGMGMDCVLMHRSALGLISWLSWPQNDDDYPFYDKARELGHRIYVDTSIQCKHYFSENGYTYKAEVCYTK